MHFHVSRSGQMYGPYTLEELQRYLASGNVLATDMAKSEEMPEWSTVAQVLGLPETPVPYTSTVGAYAAGGAYAAPGYSQAAFASADPPNLNWVLLLLFGIFTCGIFTILYEIIQIVWLKKVQPRSSASLFFILYLVCWTLNLGATFSRFAMLSQGFYTHRSLPAIFFSALTSIAILVLLIAYRFAMRGSLEEYFNTTDPIGLRLGPVMTFFFGSLYFQYHFNRINTIKQAVRYARPGL